MIIGTSKNSDTSRNRVVFDAGHGLAALGTGGRGSRDGVGFGQNRVDILGGFRGEKIGYVGKKKMTTAVETLVDILVLTIGSVDGYRR